MQLQHPRALCHLSCILGGGWGRTQAVPGAGRGAGGCSLQVLRGHVNNPGWQRSQEPIHQANRCV